MVSLSSCIALSLLVHVGSVHTEPGHNNTNPGLGLSCAYSESVSLSAGVFYNSQRRPSAYVSAEYSVPLVWDTRIGVVVGAATGYDLAPVVPTAGIALHGPEMVGIRASVVSIPGTKWNAGVSHLVLSKQF